LFFLKKNNPGTLLHFEADANDLVYQFWKKRALSIEWRTHKVYLQKPEYIPPGLVFKRSATNHNKLIQTWRVKNTPSA